MSGSSRRTLAALIAAVMIGMAILQNSDTRIGSLLLIPALFAAGYAAMARDDGRGRPSYGSLPVAVLLVPSAVIFVAAFNRAYWPPTTLWTIGGAVAVTAMLVAAAATILRPQWRHAWPTSVVAYAVVLLLVILARDVRGVLDVAVFQSDGARALLDGLNPFAITFIDPYPPHLSVLFYGEGISIDGILQFGYPYFPFGLLVIAPFELIFGDFRVVHGASAVAVATMLGSLVPGSRWRLPGIVFMLVSPSMYLVSFGWMDPLVALAMVGTVWVAVRAAAKASWAFGMAVALKQTVAFLLVPSVLLVARPWTARALIVHFVKAFALLAVTVLPFFVWAPERFWWSVVELQFQQPFRPDSIALPALFADAYASLPGIITAGAGFLLVLGVSVALVIRSAPGPRNFALVSAFVLVLAFAVSKQAFPNYYIVAISLLCAGAAVYEGVNTKPAALDAELVDSG